MFRFFMMLCLALASWCATAQDKAPAVQSVNIQDVRPDASDDPNYAQQNNAERGKVQPGNNAPMWRQVGAGAEGYSSLPKSTAPEAGVLIQPFVQYPGAPLTNAGEAWRQVRNQWIIPYGGSLLLIVIGAIAIFYWRKGMIRLHGAPTGKEIERFTPIGPNTVEWSITFDDPHTWARPWTFAMTLTHDETQPVYEYACHEGNHGLEGVLRGARYEEQQAAQKSAPATKPEGR